MKQAFGLRGVLTAAALAVVRDGTVLFETVDTARLTMRAFSDDFLERYLDAVGDAAEGAHVADAEGLQPGRQQLGAS